MVHSFEPMDASNTAVMLNKSNSGTVPSIPSERPRSQQTNFRKGTHSQFKAINTALAVDKGMSPIIIDNNQLLSDASSMNATYKKLERLSFESEETSNSINYTIPEEDLLHTLSADFVSPIIESASQQYNTVDSYFMPCSNQYSSNNEKDAIVMKTNCSETPAQDSTESSSPSIEDKFFSPYSSEPSEMVYDSDSDVMKSYSVSSEYSKGSIMSSEQDTSTTKSFTNSQSAYRYGREKSSKKGKNKPWSGKTESFHPLRLLKGTNSIRKTIEMSDYDILKHVQKVCNKFEQFYELENLDDYTENVRFEGKKQFQQRILKIQKSRDMLLNNVLPKLITGIKVKETFKIEGLRLIFSDPDKNEFQRLDKGRSFIRHFNKKINKAVTAFENDHHLIKSDIDLVIDLLSGMLRKKEEYLVNSSIMKNSFTS